MIFRDDDIGLETQAEAWRFERFIAVHELFKEFKVTHTIAIMMNDLDQATELLAYLKQPENAKWLSLQLHCWTHDDFTTLEHRDLLLQFSKSFLQFITCFNTKPAIWYPPYNATNKECNKIAGDFGLIARPDKITLEQYIRCDGDVKEDTINFHYWADDLSLIRNALEIYTEK